MSRILQVLLRMQDLQTQHIASVCWAYAKLGNDYPQLFDSLAVAAKHAAPLLLPRQISAIAWSFASEAMLSCFLSDVIALEFLYQDPFSISGAPSSHRAPAALRIECLDLLSVLARQLVPQVEALNAQGIANVAWAYASLAVVDQQLMDALADVACRRESPELLLDNVHHMLCYISGLLPVY